MEHNYSHYSLDELREMRETINREIEKRRMVRDERFNTMMKAIREFEEVCPDAEVCDYDIGISIHHMTDRDNWFFS